MKEFNLNFKSATNLNGFDSLNMIKSLQDDGIISFGPLND